MQAANFKLLLLYIDIVLIITFVLREIGIPRIQCFYINKYKGKKYF